MHLIIRIMSFHKGMVRQMSEQFSIFQNSIKEPLAERMRPYDIDDIVGQDHLLGKGKVLRNAIEKDQITSMIFWGPPGVGKTTLANAIANKTRAKFITFSAVNSGVKEIRKVMEEAERGKAYGIRTIVFIDEIHRFNKAQQDAFLPYVEKGSIILIGATTENPSFEINGALLSRSRVYILHKLEKDDIIKLLKRAIESKKGFGDISIMISDEVLEMIALFTGGDARSALLLLEMAVLNGEVIEKEDGTRVTSVTKEIVELCTSKKTLIYDKNGEEHYNLISALHKSMRNSDPDASVYWLARMLEAGEDPLYIARRVVRFASEDIGLADPGALRLAISAYQGCHFIGMPECNVILTEAVIYMAMSPKSNAMEVAYLSARDDALNEINEPVPMHIRNAPTKLMKEAGYGKGYKYAHDYEDKITDMRCLPDSLAGKEYYMPTDEGFEERYKKRLIEIKNKRKRHAEKNK